MAFFERNTNQKGNPIVKPKGLIYKFGPTLFAILVCVAAGLIIYSATCCKIANIHYLYASLIGLGVAYTELLTRYNKADLMLKVDAIWLYLLVNAAASCLAFFVINEYYIDSFTAAGKPADKFKMVLAAGFGALFILRSSFSNIKLKSGESLDIGPGAIVNLLLSWSEKEFDKIAALQDMDPVKNTMKAINFDEAKYDLPAISIKLMRSVDANEAVNLAKEVASIADGESDENVKSYLLGATLMLLVGIDVLRNAVDIYTSLVPQINLDDDLEDLESKMESFR